ncbi:hypothetical protein GONAM_15_01600 [Gordonia namibiensis NBRC 108229]|uniref:Enoyl-CoA hydratase n=1 Tax=Gordonia namibiensis NBRC 108229 TaxID=1208314 RepID=K6WM29_9ACTN|nr:hypothetical protein [Gordonia namibiensis]GAC00451.1 hypothetical protein GONAM_15_01600 [Gordonia namibiensis NBRC 108229]
MTKVLATLAVVATALVGSLIGSGSATAVPIQQLPVTSSTFGTFGDHSFCRGAVTIKLEGVAKRRGILRVTATSHGFRGQGASWKRNPKCRVLFGTGYTSIRGLSLERFATGTFGLRPGDKKSWDVDTGSGLASVSVHTYANKSPVRVVQGGNAGFYVMVP